MIIRLIILTFSVNLFADGFGRADSHAPIGVMGEHIHKQGEFMVSYRYMRMSMKQNKVGSSDVSNDEVLADYMISPQSMDMEMHMLGGMYAPTNDVTLMLMLPLVKKNMSLINRMSSEFETRSFGVGDMSITGLFALNSESPLKHHYNIGLFIPTGAIDEKDETPMGRVLLPYPMQQGSGTYDFLLGYTMNSFEEKNSFGFQVKGVLRTGVNKRDYRLGNHYHASLWYTWLSTPHLSYSLRGALEKWENIHGRDQRLNPMMVPTADARLREGQQAKLSASVNYLFESGHRLALEYGVPIYQHLSGPQLAEDNTFTLGWQLAF